MTNSENKIKINSSQIFGMRQLSKSSLGKKENSSSKKGKEVFSPPNQLSLQPIDRSADADSLKTQLEKEKKILTDFQVAMMEYVTNMNKRLNLLSDLVKEKEEQTSHHVAKGHQPSLPQSPEETEKAKTAKTEQEKEKSSQTLQEQEWAEKIHAAMELEAAKLVAQDKQMSQTSPSVSLEDQNQPDSTHLSMNTGNLDIQKQTNDQEVAALEGQTPNYLTLGNKKKELKGRTDNSSHKVQTAQSQPEYEYLSRSDRTKGKRKLFNRQPKRDEMYDFF